MTVELTILVRPMTVEDISAVVEIEKESFTTPWTPHAFRLEMRNSLAVYKVVEVDGRVAAYGGMWLILDEGHVTNIAVHPDFRGRHLGRKIMEVLMDEARQRKLLRMTLEVRKQNHVAIALYKDLGFLLAGIRPGYYQDTGEDALIMWIELNNDRREMTKEL